MCVFSDILGAESADGCVSADRFGSSGRTPLPNNELENRARRPKTLFSRGEGGRYRPERQQLRVCI